MATKDQSRSTRATRPENLGDFQFLGGGGDHDGSVAFSDISFPSHVSDLESFHSDLDLSLQSRRESLCTDDGQSDSHNVDRKKDDGELSDFPEQAAENVDVVLAAVKAAAMQDSGSERSGIDNDQSGNMSSDSNLHSSRFISKESFPESLFADVSHSWIADKSESNEEIPEKPPVTVSINEKSETSLAKPDLDSRLSEKFLVPSKTPDNGQTEYDGERFDRSPWSFSGDSLLFQTPKPTGNATSLAKDGSSSKQATEKGAKPSSSSTLVGTNQPLRQSKERQLNNRASKQNNEYSTPREDRLSDMEFGRATFNPFDGSYNDGLNNDHLSKASLKRKPKPSSSSTPVEENQSDLLKQKSNTVTNASKDDSVFTKEGRISDINLSQAVYNPFDGTYQEGFAEMEFENGKSLFEDGDGFFGKGVEEGFSFQSGGDAAKRLDEDEKIFEESHQFDKEDAMVDINGQSFSYYLLPEDTRRSLSKARVNNSNDKGDVGTSFGEFFATKTEELGRLGDGSDTRPRPQFSDTLNAKVSPDAMPPRPLYRPSSPEGSDKDKSYQPRFADLEKPQQKSHQPSQSQDKTPVSMGTRSLPYGAEADDDQGVKKKTAEERKQEAPNDNRKDRDTKKEGDRKSSYASIKSRQASGQSEPDNANRREDSRESAGGLELNNSTLAALKFCNSSEGSKLSKMTSNELKSLSKTLAQANVEDAEEIFTVLVNFINKKMVLPSKQVIENTQRLSEVFESTKAKRESDGRGSELQDRMTFYHNTSCEVSPTDRKLNTMSSISSPPLDTSSPKSSGSSIGIQTDSHGIGQVSTITTTLTTVTSSGISGMHSGTHGSSDQITRTAEANVAPPKHYGGVSAQTTVLTSPLPTAEYVALQGQSGYRNTIPPTSLTRTLTPEPQNTSPSRSYERMQSVTVAATRSVQSQQLTYGGDSRPLGYAEPGTLHPPVTATYRPEAPGYPDTVNQASHIPRLGEPSIVPGHQVGASANASEQQYYQTTRTDQLDPRSGFPVPRTGHFVATSSHAVTASCQTMPVQGHPSGHVNAERSQAFAGNNHGNAGPRHAGPPPYHAIPALNYAPAGPNQASVVTDPAVPLENRAIPAPVHEFANPQQVVSVSGRVRTLQTNTSGFSIPQTTSHILAQSCPTFSSPRFTKPDTDPRFGAQKSQTSVPGGYSKPHSISRDDMASFQHRHAAPSRFHAPKPMSAPHTQTVFQYENVVPDEFRVINDDGYGRGGTGTHITRPLGWSGPGPRQGEEWNSRTERTSQIQMVIPPVLDFPGVLCVGTSAEADLSIYNPTSRWIRCSSDIVSCTVNGLKVDTHECPFSIRGKTMIGPKLTENIKVDFKCLSAGVYVAEMKVISTPVASTSGDIETSSAFVSLQGFAEEPKIEIVADELRTLDFGELHHGCKRVKPLRIYNKGMTTVPLKMRICSNSSPGAFIFSKANTPEAIPELELQNSSLKCLVPTVNDLGMKAEPLVIWVELVGKNSHCFEKSDEPQVVSAGINIQLDAGTVAKILGNIQLSAVVGFTKIQIPKAFQMAMCLSSPVGKRVSREFPFTNAGNICSNVELTIPKHLDVFSVAPEKFQVRPGMAVMVKVMFTPLVKDTYESVIQVSEPDNDNCYEVLLRGSAVEPQAEVDEGPPILSNKSWLCWTGVDLGNAMHQRLFLLNDSADQSIHFQAMILGEHSDFEIQRMRSEFTKGGSLSQQMVLRPKERMPIYVLFAPSSFGVFKSALVLKPDRGPRFQIPLYAYGGRSCLSFLDLSKTSEGYNAQLGDVSLGRRNILKVTVKNTGHRAAFIKAVCYADFKIRLHYHQTHLSIVPSEFVLPERSSKELVIVYQPLQDDAKACQYDMKRVATIVFYHGDEVLRQWYRRNSTKQHEVTVRRPSRNLKHDDIRFDKVFQDENCAAEDFDFPDLENNEQIFDSHISLTLLNLFGGSEKHVVQTGMGEESIVMATPRRRRTEPETKTSAGFKNDETVEANEDLGLDHSSFSEWKKDTTVWSLIPEKLSLKVPVQGSSESTKKVQLLNFSDRPLEFELIWPAHCIAVTPHTGTIPQKSQATINISAWGSIVKSGVDLPWAGTAYVKCDGIKKAIAIQIHNPLVSENSPAPSVIDKPLSAMKTNKGEQRLSQTYTALVRPVNQTQLLKVTPTLIDFSEVEVNKASCSTVTIENISSSSLRWKISSFAPAYAKVSNESSELLRATYPVFSFSTQTGFIRANQITKIEVEFRARDSGEYCQIWECQTNPESPLTSTKVRLELSGKAVVMETSSGVVDKDVDKHSTDTGKVSSRESLPELPSKETNEVLKGKAEVYLQSEDVEFPTTNVGQTSTARIKICNKSSMEQQFRITTPSSPFYMKCTSLITKPSHYLKIPVHFSPQEAGKHYEATVVFENIKSGEHLTAKLRANSL